MLKSTLDTDRLSIKLGMAFAHLGISPNAWTLMSLVPAVGGLLALASYQDLFAGLILFFLSGFIDAIDGAVARVTSRVSALGAFLDGVIDRYVEFLLLTGLLFYLLDKPDFIVSNAFWIALLIFGSIMPSYVRAYADHREVVTEARDHRKMGGLLERAERLTLMYVGMFLGIYDLTWLVYVLAATAVLANFTAFQRIWYVARYKAQE